MESQIIVVEGYVDGKLSREFYSSDYFPGFNETETKPGDMLRISMPGESFFSRRKFARALGVSNGAKFKYISSNVSDAFIDDQVVESYDNYKVIPLEESQSKAKEFSEKPKSRLAEIAAIL